MWRVSLNAARTDDLDPLPSFFNRPALRVERVGEQFELTSTEFVDLETYPQVHAAAVCLVEAINAAARLLFPGRGLVTVGSIRHTERRGISASIPGTVRPVVQPLDY